MRSGSVCDGAGSGRRRGRTGTSRLATSGGIFDYVDGEPEAFTFSLVPVPLRTHFSAAMSFVTLTAMSALQCSLESRRDEAMRAAWEAGVVLTGVSEDVAHLRLTSEPGTDALGRALKWVPTTRQEQEECWWPDAEEWGPWRRKSEAAPGKFKKK